MISPICFANIDAIHDLEKRLAIHPPSKEDYAPLIDVVTGQMMAIRFHDFERAYFFYTSKEFRAKTSFLDFTRFVEVNRVLTANKSITSTDVRIEKNIGYYTGVVVANDNSRRNIRYRLVMEDGSWKVHGIELLNK